MSPRVSAAERLLDLVIALTHTPHRMTKEDIRRRVNGYCDATSTESFERMFERDKDQLRELGIPILTLTDVAHEDDVGYRIDTSEYALPPVTFTPAEIGVLSVAAQVWQHSTLTSDSHRGLTKIRAVSDGYDPEPYAGMTMSGPAPDKAFVPLLNAISDRAPVTFTYRAASTAKTQLRTVEPWRITAQDHGWYLLGYDLDRQAQRSYRLSRICGNVRRAGQPGSVVVPARAEPPADTTTTLTLALLPERAVALRQRGIYDPESWAPPGRQIYRMQVADPQRWIGELAGYADAVLVLGPPHIRTAVRSRLEAARVIGEEG